MFFSIRALGHFPQCIFPRFWYFFLLTAYPINSFFLWQYICLEFMFLIKHFSSQQQLSWSLKMWLFPVSISTILRKTKSFITIVQIVNPKKKKWCQTERLLKKVVAKVYPLPLIRTQMLTVGLKCIRNYFLVFYYHLSYTCGEIICWTCLLFLSLNPLDSQFGHFVLRTSLKELY